MSTNESKHLILLFLWKRQPYLDVRGVPIRAVLADGGSGGRPIRELEGGFGDAPSTGLPRGGVPGNMSLGIARFKAGLAPPPMPLCC